MTSLYTCINKEGLLLLNHNWNGGSFIGILSIMTVRKRIEIYALERSCQFFQHEIWL